MRLTQLTLFVLSITVFYPVQAAVMINVAGSDCRIYADESAESEEDNKKPDKKKEKEEEEEPDCE